MKRTPLKRKTPMKRAPWSKKPRSGLRQVSTRRRRELKEYSERRKSFLAMPENRWCPVAASSVLEEIVDAGLTGRGEIYIVTKTKVKRKRTTDVHHKAGREGKLLNDERHWLAVSREGHDWIHAHPNEARKRGWLL